MYCNKCGKETSNDAAYCGACGAKQEVVVEQNPVIKEVAEESGSKKRSLWRWILWWEVDSGELRRQVENYASLKLTSSYRGIATLWLVFSVMITLVIFGLGDYDYYTLLDVGILAVLAFFVYFGHRWAMVCAMIYWTFNKIVMLVDDPSTLVMQVLWWVAYMGPLFRAYKVEKERQRS